MPSTPIMENFPKGRTQASIRVSMIEALKELCGFLMKSTLGKKGEIDRKFNTEKQKPVHLNALRFVVDEGIQEQK